MHSRLVAVPFAVSMNSGIKSLNVSVLVTNSVMIKKGYTKSFSVAVTATSSVLDRSFRPA